MKKTIAAVLSVILIMSLAACRSGSSDKSDTAALVEENGVETHIDTTNSPFDNCGIHTVVDTSAGTVTFTKTDKNGNDTVEYLKFIPAENTVEKYYYVSMMGTGFYYYYDLNVNEMVRLENDSHEDSTESAKKNGRFDSAAETMKSEVEALEDYFSTQFGMSIKDAAAGK